jgi:hypothetical protein
MIRRTLLAVLFIVGAVVVATGPHARATQIGCGACAPGPGSYGMNSGPFKITLATPNCLATQVPEHDSSMNLPWDWSTQHVDPEASAILAGASTWKNYTENGAGTLNGATVINNSCDLTYGNVIIRQQGQNEDAPERDDQEAAAWTVTTRGANGAAIGWEIVLHRNTVANSSEDDLRKLLIHEFGHVLGYDDMNGCAGQTWMYKAMDGFPSGSSLTPNDICGAQTDYRTTSAVPGTICSWVDYDSCPSSQFDFADCTCSETPLLISVSGRAYDLTTAQNGVLFDIFGDGRRRQVAWTSGQDEDKAFLVLDRDSNGFITSGKELFGGVTQQTATSRPNGFNALAMFDSEDHGGNGDGWITASDAVWQQLRLWNDRNHNGVSEADELLLLGDKRVTGISLDYIQSERRDPAGNHYRYAAKVLVNGGPFGVVYDVFLRVNAQQ